MPLIPLRNLDPETPLHARHGSGTSLKIYPSMYCMYVIRRVKCTKVLGLAAHSTSGLAFVLTKTRQRPTSSINPPISLPPDADPQAIAAAIAASTKVILLLNGWWPSLYTQSTREIAWSWFEDLSLSA